MPCRDHGISLRETLAGFFRGPWGTSNSSGKVFPEAPSVAVAPDTCETLAGFFRGPLGGLLIYRGKDSPKPLRSLTVRIPARNSQAFSVVPGGLPIHRGKLPVYGVSSCLISMQKRKSVLLLRPCLDDLRAGRNIVGQPDVASDDAVVADSDPSQDRGV